MIIVTGATGKLGSDIVQRLLTRVPAARVGVSVRDPAKATELAARGVRVRLGNFNDRASLAAAFEGATRVLVVSANEAGGHAVAQHTAAVDAALGAGVERVFYTSHQGAGAGSRFAPMRDHDATEHHLAETRAPFTSLRNGFYASTLAMFVGRALQTGELVAPADGPVSWTAHADLAEAAALLLTGAQTFDGATPPLTAAETLDLADVARILSELTGREVRRVVAADEAWTAAMVAHGVPAARADLLLGMFHASRRGEFAVTDPTLAALLGRAPTTARSLLEALVAAG